MHDCPICGGFIKNHRQGCPAFDGTGVYARELITTSGRELITTSGMVINWREVAGGWLHTPPKKRRCTYCGNEEPNCGCGRRDYQ